MKRDFLENLGLEKEAIDKILDEHSKDIGREKAKADQAKEDLAAAQTTLADREKDLEDLKKSAGDSAEIQKKLDELQAKYDTETQEYKNQLAERDYTGAVSRAISEAGIKFSSKAAERAFIADLQTNRLELKDGALVDFEKYLNSQKEADPAAFASDKPAPSFSRPAGKGAPATNTLSRGEQLAKEIGGAAAKSREASNNIISQYMGGGKN